MNGTLVVLQQTSGYVAVAKPAGLTVIPGRPTDSPSASVRELLEAQLGRKVWVVHRIDRDTSGVLLFALDAGTHRTLSMAFENGKIEKRYLALVEGVVAGPWTAEQALVPARRNRMRVARPAETGKAAVTRFSVRRHWRNVSLVEAFPLTGRTHQIRVHLQAAGHPLVFDHQYGRDTPVLAETWGGPAGEVVLSRTPLHAESLSFQWNGSTQTVTAEVPSDMARAITLLERMS